MKSISKRAKQALSLEQFNNMNKPMEVGHIQLDLPTERQYVLRCLIKRTFEDLAIPEYLEWTRPMVEMAFKAQESIGIRHPFCYITVRHGMVTTKTDDVWHVDGFSLNVTHLPEQNYLWSSHTPTEYVTKKIDFPSDFNPFKHNIHEYFNDVINENDKIKVLKPKTVYCMDPYIIHRRPSNIDTTKERTFIRVSFTPIEIADKNNTFNPLMKTNYTRDGIGDFRKNLIRYTHEM